MATIKMVGVVGSLRKASFNRALMNAIKAAAPADVSLEVLEIGTLPFFNQELEADYPKEAHVLKEKIAAAQGVIIATPEYNRSVPGVLKNFIDWMSRPSKQSVWPGKVVGIVGASSGAIGTALAQFHLKQVMLHLDVRLISQPEFYVSNAKEKIDNKGVVTDAVTLERIGKFWEAVLHEVRRGA